MGKILQWLVVVVVCVYFKFDGVYGKSKKFVNKHGSESGNNLQTEHNRNLKESVKRRLSNSVENANEKKKAISKKLNEGTITTEDYLKSLTSTQPIMASKHSGTNPSDSSAVENTKEKSQIDKSDDEMGKQHGTSTRGKKDKNEITKEKKSEIESPEDENSKEDSNTFGNIHKVTKTKIEDNSNSLKHEAIQKDNADNNLTETKTTVSSAKHEIHKHQKSATKNQTNKPKGNRKKEKKAKKLLVKFFHTELDDDEHAHGKQVHVAKENEHDEQNTQASSPESDVQHAKEEYAKKTHVVKDNDHDENDSQIKVLNGETNENEHGASNARVSLATTHTKDEESTLAEISDKLYKRTGLQSQPQVSTVNNKVIETVLPSGPNAGAPQHVKLSSEPTHVIFKPVHKYYPAIHRYMTKPIHRYLNKPVDLSRLNPPLEGQEFATPQVKEYTTTPLIEHNVQIPQVVANNLAPVSGGLGDKQSPLEVKQASSLPGHQVPALLANDQPPPVPQVRNYHTDVSRRIMPGRLVHDHHLLPGDIAREGTVRIFTQMPPRIQPVLVHPHRLSPTGECGIQVIFI